MTSLKLVGAALMLSTAFATPVFAQSAAGLPELPGNYAFFSPNDDISPAVQAVQPARVVVPEVRRPTRPRRAYR
ncbi:MAG: hypothetical protein WCC54_03070 [Pseudolabrys sp.]|jgi:hypothetical protein